MNDDLAQYGSYGKLTDWEIEPSLRNLKAEFMTTVQYHDTKMQDILRWNEIREVKHTKLNDYNQTRSTVEPKLVKKQLGWKYPSLTEPFLGSKKLFNIEPRTFEDSLSANQNEIVLNWQFDTIIDKVSFTDDFVRAAVDDGTVIVRLGWKRVTETVTKEFPIFEYTPLSEEEGKQLLEEIQPIMELKQENAAEFLKQDEAVRETARQLEENGTPFAVKVTGREPRQYEKVITNQPTLEVLNPNDFYVDTTCEGDFSKARFVIYCYETTRADLIKDGRFKNLQFINWDSIGNDAISNHSLQYAYGKDYTYDDVKDPNRRKVKVFEYWGHHDKNGDGMLEPIVASWIGEVMIRLEDNPYADGEFPFVMAKYLPIKKELYGETDAEILQENQKTYGAILRGIIDSLGKSANSQIGIAKGALDDVNKDKFNKGQNFEYDVGATTPGNEIIQYAYPRIDASTLQILQFINDDAEALSGTRGFSQGINGDSFGDVAAGVNATLTSTAKREMSILRRFSKAFTDIGSKIAAMNQMFLAEEEVIRITNKGYVTIKREDLKGDYDLKVEISTNELDEKKAQDLAMIFQTIGPDMQAKLTNEIFGEYAELKKMPTLADRIRNQKPTEEEQKINELNMRKLVAEVEEVESKAEANLARADLDSSKADTEDTNNLNAVSGLEHAQNKELQSEQSKGNMALEIVKQLAQPRKEGEKPGDIKTALTYLDLNDEKSKTEVQEISDILAYYANNQR